MKNIKVGSFKNCTHYVGRKESYKHIGKDFSILGNPFKLYSEKDRNIVCDNYEKYFHDQLKSNPEFKNAVDNLINDLKYNNVILGCFCYPKRCHANTIQNYINSIRESVIVEDYFEF